MQVVINKKTAILSEMLKWMTIFGSLAYIPSLIACMYEELYLLAVIDTVCYAALLGTFVAKTSHLFRFISVLVISLILGGTVLVITGTDGAGHLMASFCSFRGSPLRSSSGHYYYYLLYPANTLKLCRVELFWLYPA